jgi:hypothetical protein
MPIFKKKQPPVIEPPKAEIIEPEPIIDDTEDEIAAVIAAICATGGTAPSKLVVRSIVRVPDQTTNWNRLAIDNTN